MSFGGFNGEHGASERAQSANRKGSLGADFYHFPISKIFDVIVRTAFFCCRVTAIDPDRVA